jgi:hypothetical protein
VDLAPSDSSQSSADALAERKASANGDIAETMAKFKQISMDDRQFSNIDASSPIRLSQQAREIISKLRQARDDAENWVK